MGTMLSPCVVIVALWIALSVCLVLAAGALTDGSDEFREFALRVVPTLNRLGLVAALLLAACGIGSLLATDGLRCFPFHGPHNGKEPCPLVTELGLRVALFTAIAVLLGASQRIERRLHQILTAEASGAEAPETCGRRMAARRLVMLSVAMLFLAGVAAALGLWLTGG